MFVQRMKRHNKREYRKWKLVGEQYDFASEDEAHGWLVYQQREIEDFRKKRQLVHSSDEAQCIIGPDYPNVDGMTWLCVCKLNMPYLVGELTGFEERLATAGYKPIRKTKKIQELDIVVYSDSLTKAVDHVGIVVTNAEGELKVESKFGSTFDVCLHDIGHVIPGYGDQYVVLRKEV